MRVGPRPIKECPRLLKKKLPPPGLGAGRGGAALWALSLFGFGGRWLGVGGVSFKWVAPGACPRRRPAPPRAPWVFARVSARVSARVVVWVCARVVLSGLLSGRVGACGGFCAAVPLTHAPARRRLAPRARVSCLPWVSCVCAAFRRLGSSLGVFWHLGVRVCGGWRAVWL